MRPEFPETPGLSTIYKWMEQNPRFAESSARARIISADTYADAAVDEAHTGRLGMTTTTQEWGIQERTADNVERSKLIVQTLMKRAGQLNPKKYGDNMKAVQDTTDRLDEIIAAMKSGPVERGGVN
jgi:hypothetical protein